MFSFQLIHPLLSSLKLWTIHILPAVVSDQTFDSCGSFLLYHWTDNLNVRWILVVGSQKTLTKTHIADLFQSSHRVPSRLSQKFSLVQHSLHRGLNACNSARDTVFSQALAEGVRRSICFPICSYRLVSEWADWMVKDTNGKLILERGTCFDTCSPCRLRLIHKWPWLSWLTIICHITMWCNPMTTTMGIGLDGRDNPLAPPTDWLCEISYVAHSCPVVLVKWMESYVYQV